MNQYTYKTPFTEEELLRDYVDLKMSQTEIAIKHGTTQKVVWNAMRKMNVPSRIAAKRNQYGPLNSSWKGGRVLVAKNKRQRGERTSFGNGYYYILNPSHPNSNKNGYVAEHILIATTERNKPLIRGELVHHKDLNKHNNIPDNLIITTPKEHSLWHNQLEEIAISFMRNGGIVFDPLTGYKKVE